MTDVLDEEAIATGREAFYRGESSSACPYRSGRRREFWLKGWFEARDGQADANALARRAVADVTGG